MYEQFCGLREAPFELTPNPKYLYLTDQHREALSNLEYGLSAAKTATVLIGEAGTGKTTLLKAALASERCRRVTCVFVSNPALTRNEFVETLARKFGLSAAAVSSKATMLTELETVLRERRKLRQVTALVVDEAQTLSIEVMEEVRLLANIETSSEKLLPLVLAGQPELASRLNDPALRQLKQRIALRCYLRPFGLAETAAYIAMRIRTAGGEPARLFTREAVTAIHDHSRGIPRLVSVICDNALVTSMAVGKCPVSHDLVLEVCRDFDLASGSGAVPGPGEAVRDADITPSETSLLDAAGAAGLPDVQGASSTGNLFSVRLSS
jgi:general secretion pathway protein A